MIMNNEKLKKVEGLELIKQVRQDFTDFFERVSSVYSCDTDIVELMQMRKYTTQEMYDLLKELKIFKVSDLSLLDMVAPISQYKTFKYFGLLGKDNYFLLAERYIIPIRDIAGKVTALVGWYPDERKYVTTPTFGFSRDAQFFNIDPCKNAVLSKDNVYLVEGIFDTLSLRSIGFNALGNMGLVMSPIKREILSRFGHIYAIPDNDKAGRSVLPYRSSLKKGRWDIYDCTYVKLKSDEIKDVDDLIKFYEAKTDLMNLGTDYLTKLTI